MLDPNYNFFRLGCDSCNVSQDFVQMDHPLEDTCLKTLSGCQEFVWIEQNRSGQWQLNEECRALI